MISQGKIQYSDFGIFYLDDDALGGDYQNALQNQLKKETWHVSRFRLI